MKQSKVINYFVETEGAKTTIRMETKTPKTNLYIIVVFLIIVSAILMINANGIPAPQKYYFVGAAIFTVILGLMVGIGGSAVLRKKVEKNQKIIIDKEQDALHYPHENFSTKLSEIKDITIQEKSTVIGQGTCLLKLTLATGEKLLNFPIANYNTAEEFRKLILPS